MAVAHVDPHGRSSLALPGPASRAGRRPEHAAAGVVRPSTNPYLSVWARCRLFERNEFRVADHPAFAGHGDLVGGLAVVVATTPFAGRVSVAATIDPGIMSNRQRHLRHHPDERDPEPRDLARSLMCDLRHGMSSRDAAERGTVRLHLSCNVFLAYVSCSETACRALLPLVSGCGPIARFPESPAHRPRQLGT